MPSKQLKSEVYDILYDAASNRFRDRNCCDF